MFNTIDMHHIQKDIIQRLADDSPLRFSELQPSHIPNNSFSYHLKKLLSSDYIESTNTGYVATRKALKVLQYSSHDQKKKNVSPATITIISVTNDAGETLILKRRKRPFVNYYGLTSGLIHRGETVEMAAMRELMEKTGIDAGNDLQFAGVIDFQYIEQDSKDMFVHAIAFVFSYDYGNKELPFTDTPYGELSWSTLKSGKILPEVQAVKDMIENKIPMSSHQFEEPTA
ncbi:MAG: NUDIX domain-containing protein [Candidatus Microsaccharimonas sp.]